ncbi:MAG: vanadium-dependent haloperoxidase [Arenicella sp.]
MTEKVQKRDISQRRKFLKLSASTGAAVASMGVLGTAQTAIADDFSALKPDRSLAGYTGYGRYRVVAAANLKQQALQQHFDETLALPVQWDNNDEKRYDDEPHFYASFSKTLPSNNFGEVDSKAFRKLRKALRKGRQKDFDAIPLDPSAERKLTNPQGALKYEISALDSHATRIKSSHTFRSEHIAAEVGEVYWQAITRDVPYFDYASDPDVAAAVSDLNGFSKTAGVEKHVALSHETLFRGETPGDLNGPFISQFLLNSFEYGPALVEQRYQVPSAGIDFMQDHSNWLNIQRGGKPVETVSFDPVRRYIYNNRALSEYVHRDLSFQAYLNACMQLIGMGSDAIAADNPYKDKISNQEGFTSLGDPFIVDLVTRAANIALTGAWFQKWRVHRFLRPEAFGGRVHFKMLGQRDYEIHSDLLNSAALQRIFSRNGSYFLPQAFIEGSPTHPSFPAGHAAIAGACVTVLKACFDENYVINNPVQADATGSSLLAYNGSDLTVGGELNKLANNISLGRCAAGVHYRQDGVQGLEVGQQQAIALLQDQSRTMNETNFDGFTFTKFDGNRINIKQGIITQL